MIKDKTLDLVKGEENDFRKLFSVCVCKPYAFQRRFIDYIGDYKKWDVNVKEGALTLDDKKYDVEFIGTTSKTDNFWCSSEIEHEIPDQYVQLMIQARKKMEELHIDSLTKGKVELDEKSEINGYDLSMIYMAFAPENTAYFNGSGDTSIYMFVKNLPDQIFQRVINVEFPNIVMEIISTFDVDQKLVIEALASEFDYEVEENENEVSVKFSEKSHLDFIFKDRCIEEITGEIC